LSQAKADWIAFTRGVSPAMARCELTHLAREPIDVARATMQHEEYERALARFGCSVIRLDADADMPDSVFIEDTAIVLDELAIVARLGARSRRGEAATVAAALQAYRPLATIEAPGTLDGGDVMTIGREIFIGRSSRTNAAALEQVRALVAPFRYRLQEIDVNGCLHLKSTVTALDDHTLLINREHVDDRAFSSFDLVDVDPSEPSGANILRVNGRLLYSVAFGRTRERLERKGFPVTTVDVSEIAKAEGAVTCCSLIVRTGGRSTGTAH
jgi:dimethylargininase